MRALLATLALAGAIATCVLVRVQAMPDERYVAMMSASDVSQAKRCAPPFGCKPPRAKAQRASAPFGIGFSGLAARAAQHLGRNPTGWARAWCGRFLRMIVPSDPGPSFDAARNWAHYGWSAKGPAPGVIGVMPHHVGIVLGRCDNGAVLMRSGNHNRVVGDGCYAPRRFIAFRSA